MLQAGGEEGEAGELGGSGDEAGAPRAGGCGCCARHAAGLVGQGRWLVSLQCGWAAVLSEPQGLPSRGANTHLQHRPAALPLPAASKRQQERAEREAARAEREANRIELDENDEAMVVPTDADRDFIDDEVGACRMFVRLWLCSSVRGGVQGMCRPYPASLHACHQLGCPDVCAACCCCCCCCFTPWFRLVRCRRYPSQQCAALSTRLCHRAWTPMLGWILEMMTSRCAAIGPEGHSLVGQGLLHNVPFCQATGTRTVACMAANPPFVGRSQHLVQPCVFGPPLPQLAGFEEAEEAGEEEDELDRIFRWAGRPACGQPVHQPCCHCHTCFCILSALLWLLLWAGGTWLLPCAAPHLAPAPAQRPTVPLPLLPQQEEAEGRGGGGQGGQGDGGEPAELDGAGGGGGPEGQRGGCAPGAGGAGPFGCCVWWCSGRAAFLAHAGRYRIAWWLGWQGGQDCCACCLLHHSLTPARPCVLTLPHCPRRPARHQQAEAAAAGGGGAEHQAPALRPAGRRAAGR